MIWLSGKKQNGKAEKIDVIEEMMELSTVKTDMEIDIKIYVNMCRGIMIIRKEGNIY